VPHEVGERHTAARRAFDASDGFFAAFAWASHRDPGHPTMTRDQRGAFRPPPRITTGA